MPLKKIEPKYYDAFRELLEEYSGIVLGANKQYLVTSRLTKLMTENSFADLGVLVDKLKAAGSNELRGRVIDLMTTNETQWFRDDYPFSVLSSVIYPGFVQEKKQHVKIWSSACSTGQEPYSIAMALLEHQKNSMSRLSASIVGTDISPTVIEQAKSGVYQLSEIDRGLTPERKRDYFIELPDGIWKLKDDISRNVSFRNFNLLDSYRALGRFDLIFCRNVLIYFSTEVRKQIIGGMTDILNDGGYLVLGASESLGVHSSSYELVRFKSGVVYKKK